MLIGPHRNDRREPHTDFHLTTSRYDLVEASGREQRLQIVPSVKLRLDHMSVRPQDALDSKTRNVVRQDIPSAIIQAGERCNVFGCSVSINLSAFPLLSGRHRLLD